MPAGLSNASHLLTELGRLITLPLITLPPYSPELNGIENLWHDLRSHYRSNRVYADYDELFDVASTTWCQHCLNTERIKSVCAKYDIPTRR